MLQSSVQCAKALLDLFHAQEERAAHLLRLLEQEREALDSGDLAVLDATAAGKGAALVDLEQLKAREARLLAGLPFGGSATPLEQALSWCDAEGDVRAACEEVIQLMVACDRHNRSNGLLVQQRLNYVRRALDVLHNAHAETLVYGPDGGHAHAGSSRLLAEG
ncbi:MAG: flagellar protein FlgN [Haliea sp.]